jgi:hypothetical protein
VKILTCDNTKQTIFITVSINPSTSVDLILGRHTLTKFDLFSLTPRALGIPNPSRLFATRQASTSVTPPPIPFGTTLPEAHCRHSGSTPNFCSCHTSTGVINQPCCMCEVHQPSCSVPAAIDRCEGYPPRPGLDPPRTTSPIPSREVGALLDTAAEEPSGIVLSVDEIDDDRTGTFRPFVSDKAEAGATPEAFLSQITFEGDADCAGHNYTTAFFFASPYSFF